MIEWACHLPHISPSHTQTCVRTLSLSHSLTLTLSPNCLSVHSVYLRRSWQQTEFQSLFYSQGDGTYIQAMKSTSRGKYMIWLMVTVITLSLADAVWRHGGVQMTQICYFCVIWTGRQCCIVVHCDWKILIKYLKKQNVTPTGKWICIVPSHAHTYTWTAEHWDSYLWTHSRPSETACLPFMSSLGSLILSLSVSESGPNAKTCCWVSTATHQLQKIPQPPSSNSFKASDIGILSLPVLIKKM